MSEPGAVDRKLAKRLVLDELFDLSLYQSLREVATGDLHSILDQLIPIDDPGEAARDRFAPGLRVRQGPFVAHRTGVNECCPRRPRFRRR